MIDITAPWDSCFFPGQRVAMSMVFEGLERLNSTCPGCGTEHGELSGREITW